MTQWITTVFLSVLMTAFVPALLLPSHEGGMGTEALLVFVEDKEVAKECTVAVKTQNGVQHFLFEDYLVGVVLAEMPASFHMEALKAQSVAARTFAMSKMKNSKHDDCSLCTDSNCCQAWYSIETAQKKLGASASAHIEKVRQAVRATEGEYLTYNDELIEAVFFSCSGGKTESAVAVWGTDVPYLQSVESLGEENASEFVSERSLPLDTFKEILLSYDRTIIFPDDPKEWVKNREFTDGGGVEYIEICGRPFYGTELRLMFELNSTAFDIEIDQEHVSFKVKGYGHRVGMSQYGANAMANNGAGYQDILLHYYRDVEICK